MFKFHNVSITLYYDSNNYYFDLSVPTQIQMVKIMSSSGAIVSLNLCYSCIMEYLNAISFVSDTT